MADNLQAPVPMTSYEIGRPKLVVALDIGSTYSGYAWQWGGLERKQGDVEMNTHWECAPIQIIKTKTCVLIECKKHHDEDVLESVAIGHKAEKMFTDEPDKPWYFFKEFKLILYSKDFSKTMEIEDVAGKMLSFFEVMSKFIEGLKNHFLEKMAKKNLNLQTIRWVVTVPAIWPLECRNFMREAAEHSGIEGNSLTIALEPEVAAIYCLNLPSEEQGSMGHIGDVGKTFLTADLGGGTADLTAVKVQGNGQLDIICTAQGNLIGGRNINSAFFQALHDTFEGHLWKKVFSDSTEVLEMEDDFEQKKVNIVSTDCANTPIRLTIPTAFRDGLHKGEISMRENTENRAGIRIDRDKLFFDPKCIAENLYKETCTRIAKTIIEVLEKPALQHVKDVVMVGGLSESNVVVSDIKTRLAESLPNRQINVFVPTSPFRAVLAGAVLFGQNPDIIRGRKCPATFGIETNSRFDTEIHREDKKWTVSSSGVVYCRDILSVHIRENQFVVLKEKQPTKTYNPVNANQTSVNLSVFMHQASGRLLDETTVMYTTDDGCKKLGEMIVEMPDTTGGTNRKIAVTMVYGTELEVSAVDETSGGEFKIRLEYQRHTDADQHTTD